MAPFVFSQKKKKKKKKKKREKTHRTVHLRVCTFLLRPLRAACMRPSSRAIDVTGIPTRSRPDYTSRALCMHTHIYI